MKKPRFPKPRDPNPLTAQIKAAEGDFQGAFAAIDRAEAPTEKLQKALADAGMGSRREMERLIESGIVTVNGNPAKLGDRVSAEDVIRVEGRLVRRLSPEAADTPRVTTRKAARASLITFRACRAAVGLRLAVLTSIPKDCFSLRRREVWPIGSCTRATKWSANTQCVRLVN